MNDLRVDVDTDRETMGRREKNKASKRRRILEAATELFTERGFEETTTAAIAKKAGIGAGTLYLYVESKEDLLVAVFREQVGPLWDEAFSLVDLDRPVLTQLLTVFNHVAEFHEHDTNLSRAYFKDLKFVTSPTVDGAEESVRTVIAQLIELLERNQVEGKLDPAVSPIGLASNLYNLWCALMGRHHAGRSTWEQYLAGLDRSFRTCLFRLVPD